MRGAGLVFRYVALLMTGFVFAAVVAWLVGRWVLWLRGWTFLVVAASWAWMGWRYASVQQRIQNIRHSSPLN